MKKHSILSVLLSVGLAFSSMSLSATAVGTRISVHDPSIIKDGNTYYVFGSHIDAGKSNDLINWKTFTNGYTPQNNVEFGDLSKNLSKAFAWAGENLEDCENGFAVWAPDVIWNPDYINPDGSKGAYVMYFCTSSTYMRSVICYATAQKIEGPYTFVDTLIYSGFTDNDSYATSSTKNVNRKFTSTNIDELIATGEVTYNNDWFNNHNYNNYLYPNAIDPTIYYDTDGKMRMVYGSWSGGIFTLDIDPATGKCIHPKTGKTADGRMIDSYFGTKIAGGYYKSGEAPFIEYNADTGYYYLWTTYGGLLSEGGYNMRVSRSKSPTGPFFDAAGQPAVLNPNTDLDSVGLKVMGNYKFSTLDTAYMACGHNSVLRDDDGRWYMFNHARFDDKTEYHEVRVREMFFNEDGWPVVTPFEYSGDMISESGYEESDIVGDYEFINHGNATDGVIINYVNIKLNADHTISGSVAGTWEQAVDSAMATLKIGGQIYKGYFIASKNEKGTKVMSFTAVGSNNQTIWGVQNKSYTGTERVSLSDYTNSNAEIVIAPDTIQDGSVSVTLSGTELLSGVNYFISNKNSGLSLDITEGKLTDGTNIQQWDFNKSWAQQWRLVSVDDTWFRIVSLGDESKCVAVAENSADDGINVELQNFTGADNQLFRLEKNGSYYGIVSKCSGGKGGLDVYEWSAENGGNVNQFAYNAYDCQLWKIEPVYSSVADMTGTFRNVNSGLYISAGGDNAEQGESTIWTLTKLTNGMYTVTNEKGLALTVENSTADNGANIQLEKLTKSVSQQFRLNCNKDGSYSLLTEVSGGNSCIDVYEISLESGANLCQWEYWGGNGQKFILEPAVLDKKVIGDVNADGEFSTADLVLLQKWLLAVPDTTLADWKAGDLCEDNQLDVFDLCMMRRELINK